MKNKKPLVALIVLLLIGVVGVTFAYFTTTETVPNVFQIGGSYSSKIEETFVPETDWLPGEEVEKIVNVMNTGEIPMVVRVKYTEGWSMYGSSELTGKLADDTDAVIINGLDTAGTKWIKDGEWWYYYKVLGAGETTDTPFMESVTLSPNLDLDNDYQYLNAKYTLNIVAETIQADGAVAEWTLSDTLVAKISGLTMD